ncbi:PapD-like protein [Collybia nuda]|uniref:PapD-like protein n=1 Tax=Collybia nuda TaxID=64659 RepID=A0A9P5YGH0_9AGAR|nr:PapD-like protein [Collybia nuda]
MSVSLNPSSSLGFKRPLTQLVKRSLTITNNNSQPIAFKVKTTAPKLYCVRPNSGRVEPGESVDVSVMLQALREEPPMNAKCKDKFLIQSTLITTEKETMALHDIWAMPEGSEEGKVHQQKLRVTYLPAEGQTLEEEDESTIPQPPNISSFINAGDSRFDTVRQHLKPNGHPEPIPEFSELPQEPPRPATPPTDFLVASEDSHDDPSAREIHATTFDNVPASPIPPAVPELMSELMPEPQHESAPQPQVVFTPAPAPAPILFPESPNAELMSKYEAAQAEINRLRATLATMSTAPPTELRQRTRALSDVGSIAETDVATAIDDSHYHHQEGVPLQVVVIIALGVFITTYLFF